MKRVTWHQGWKKRKGDEREIWGGAIRDHEDCWLSDFSVNFGVGSPILTKLLPVEHGLNLAWNLGFKGIILESDCQETVQIILSLRLFLRVTV
ncbi:hypothetical protein Lal_00040333 [Lupinus albus]|nr:hypothetical protein Lal_00040333 [Lupinus albus]